MNARKKRKPDNRGRAPDQLTGHEFNAGQARLALAKQAARQRVDTTTHAPRDGSDDPARSGMATRSAVFAVRPGGAF